MSRPCRPLNKNLLTSAFEKMGPDRLDRALRYGPTAKNWERCFIAVAYPELRLSHRIGLALRSPEVTVAIETGLEEEEVLELVTAHDHCLRCQEHLRHLASEWLETNRNRQVRKEAYETEVRNWKLLEDSIRSKKVEFDFYAVKF